MQTISQKFTRPHRCLAPTTSLLTMALMALALLASCDTSRPPPSVVTQPAASGIAAPADEPSVPNRPLAGPNLPPAPMAASVEPVAEPADGGQLVEEIWDAYS